VPIPALALEHVEHLPEADRLLHELLERGAGDRGSALTPKRHVARAQLDQVVLERRLVLQVLLRPPPLHAVEWWLRGREMPPPAGVLGCAVGGPPPRRRPPSRPRR